MFKIRDFSRFTRITMKMLRHYDDLGLLKPVLIDPDNGYRYYSSDQLPRLNRIIALKDLGFSLDQVGRLLDEDLSSEEIRGMFRMRQAEIEQHLQLEQSRLSQVETRLRYLEQNPLHLNFDVVVREVAPVLVASIRQKVSNDNQPVYRLFEELETFVARRQARAFNSPFVIYHDEEFKEESADLEVAVPILDWIGRDDRVTVREILGVPSMACLVYTGGYDRMDEALNALMIWIEANGYRNCGPLREVYLRFSADDPRALNLPKAFLTDRRELFVTEIQLPVEKIQSVEQRRPEMTEIQAKDIGLSEIGQISLPIHDVQPAIQFYRDTLGMKFLFDIANAAFFDCGGVRLMLSMPEKAEFAHAGSIIYYRVNDLQAEYELLSSRGVKFEDRPHLIAHMDSYDLWMAFFRDPDQNLIGLMSEISLGSSQPAVNS